MLSSRYSLNYDACPIVEGLHDLAAVYHKHGFVPWESDLIGCGTMNLYFNVEEIEDWAITTIVTQINNYKKIRHLHRKSALACATGWVGKHEWLCCVCLEQVPLGVLFAARTIGLNNG